MTLPDGLALEDIRATAVSIQDRAMEFLGQHRIFSTADLDEGEHFASNIWERNKSSVTRGRYGLRWNQLVIDKVEFSYIEHDVAVDLSAQGPLSDHFRLFFHTGGAMHHRVKGQTFISHPGNAVVHSPASDLHLDIEPFKLMLVSFSGDAVNSALAQRFRKLPPFQSWLGVLPETAALEALRGMNSWLVGELERPGSPLGQDGKARLHAERLLLQLFVECLSEAAPESAQIVQDASHLQAQRAAEWIESHLAEPIAIDDVATAAGVGVRSLQLSFQRVHGCSPQEFITRRRLDAARQMLLSAGPDATVTAIATTLGFFELGRFSQRYRLLFGETPSSTLARART